MPLCTSSGRATPRRRSYSRTALRISSAAFTAARGAFSIATGAPNTATTQSPARFSTRPPCLTTIASSRRRHAPMIS